MGEDLDLHPIILVFHIGFSDRGVPQSGKILSEASWSMVIFTVNPARVTMDIPRVNATVAVTAKRWPTYYRFVRAVGRLELVATTPYLFNLVKCVNI
jgi:hypothetical protein